MFLKSNFKSKIFKQIILILINIGVITSIFPIHILNSSILAANNNFYVHNLSELKSAILESQNNDVIIIKNNIYIDDEEVINKNLDYSFDFDENTDSNDENFLFTINNKKITIKGTSPNITISAKNSMGFFKCENNADLILDNIILDGGENFKSKPFSEEIPKDIDAMSTFKKMSQYLKNENIIRCNENCKLTMNNCTIQNCCTLNNALIHISGSNAYINKNNKITKCACYQSSPIYLMASENQDIKSHVKIEDISLENCIVTGDNIATAISADEMSYLIIKHITTNNCINVNSDIKIISIFENSKCFFYDENATAITIYNENGYIRTLKKYQNSNNLKIINKNNIENTEFVNKITFDHLNENKHEIEPIYLSDNESISDLKNGPLGSFYTTSTQGGTEDYEIPTPSKLGHKFMEWMYDNNTKVSYETKFEKDTKLKPLWINENGDKIKLDNIEKIDKDNSTPIQYSDKSPIESNADVKLNYTTNSSDIITNTYEISLDGGNKFHNINNINDIKIIETTPNKLKLQLYKNGIYNIKIKAIDSNNNYVESDPVPLININKSITPINSVLSNNRLKSAKRKITCKQLTEKSPESIVMSFNNLYPPHYTYGDDPFTISVTGCDETNTITYTSSNPDIATIDSTGTITIHKTGRFTITAKQVDDKNNEISTKTSDIITVEPCLVEIHGLTVNNKIYDGNNTAIVNTTNAYIKGKLDKDDLTFKIGSANFENKSVGINKTVTFSNFELSGDQKDNYKLISQPNNVTANIIPKSVKITNIKIKDKMYDGTNIAEFDGMPKLCDVIKGDDVSLINGTPTFSKTNVGKNIPIDFTYFSLIGDDSSNYSIIHPTNITANIINPTKNTSYQNDKLENYSFLNSNNDNISIDSDYISTDNESPSNSDNLSDSVFDQKDSKTGIWVYAPAGVFNSNTKLFVKDIDKTSSEFNDLYIKIDQDKTQSINNTHLFQIHVENEQHEIVNPNISKGSITIRIPIPNSYDPDKFKIYGFDQNSNNEINKQIVKINEQYYYEFQTNNLSTYATVNKQISGDFIKLLSITPIISAFTIVLIIILIKLKHSKM